MKKSVKFGVIADLHVPLIHNTEKRITAFLNECREENVDFIIQLGDFAHNPEDVACPSGDSSPNEKIISIFNNFEKPSFHVIGNHDCDTTSKEEMLEFWNQIHKPYYSFDINGYHFVVLDCNYLKIDGEYISYDKGNYFYLNTPAEPKLPYIPDEQIEWLKEDLANTPYPAILFSHQRLCKDPIAIRNYDDLRKAIDSAPNKVLISINGHEHIDNAEKVGNTWYYNVNSASFYWLGEGFEVDNRYGEDIDKKYPMLKYTVPYDNALYAIITLDEDGASVKGKKAEFVGPAPEEIGAYDEGSYYAKTLRSKITASIEDRYMSFK